MARSNAALAWNVGDRSSSSNASRKRIASGLGPYRSWLVASAARWSKAAAWLLIPYLAWLIYAASLNAGIIVLN